jgi:hypothetical protein
MVIYEITSINVRVALTGVLLGNLRERDHLEDPSLNGRII